MKGHTLSRGLAAFLLAVVSITLSLAAIAAAPAAAEPRSALATLSICFVNDGQTTCVDRPAPLSAATTHGRGRSLTRWLIAGRRAANKPTA